MKMTRQQIRAIIINECQLRDVSHESIMFGCELAEVYFDKGNSFSACIEFGVSVAEMQ